jgi:ribonuclease BN (tRNA processing enzyme)
LEMSIEKPDMIVTVLGSGTCVPSIERSSCSVMLEVSDNRLLIDSGPGTMRRLLRTGTTIFDVDYIFYSHFHPDHTAELVPFIFATKYPDMGQRQTALTIIAGVGFENFFAGLKTVYGKWIELDPELVNIIQMDNRSADLRRLKNFTVRSAPVEHNPESIAYRITSAGGRSVVYSGDTDYSENLIELSKGADLLICESAMPDDYRVKGHLTPSLAGDIATRAGVKKLVLTHFYPECDQTDIELECRKTYDGPLVLAEDLMRIEVFS